MDLPEEQLVIEKEKLKQFLSFSANDIRSMGRNDKCYCGSGKKFKQCCIDKRNSRPMGRAPVGVKKTIDLKYRCVVCDKHTEYKDPDMYLPVCEGECEQALQGQALDILYPN